MQGARHEEEIDLERARRRGFVKVEWEVKNQRSQDAENPSMCMDGVGLVRVWQRQELKDWVTTGPRR